MDTYAKELEVAVEAVKRAMSVCERVRATLQAGEHKSKEDRSPVTVADFAAQAVILRALGQAFPDEPAVAEEDADDLAGDANAEIRGRVIKHVQAVEPALDEAAVLAAIGRGVYEGGADGRFWTLDPIDGTKGFLRNDQYAVALALIENGVPVLGVLGCPALPQSMGSGAPVGCMLTAVKGGGARLLDCNGNLLTKIRVSAQTEMAQARFCESVESGHSRHDWAEAVARATGITAEPVRMDSQCKYAAIARGDAEVYLRLPTRPGYVEKIWDHAAGWVCVVEAGGVVTDIHDKPLDFSRGRTLAGNEGIVATNGKFHRVLVEAVQQNA